MTEPPGRVVQRRGDERIAPIMSAWNITPAISGGQIAQRFGRLAKAVGRSELDRIVRANHEKISIKGFLITLESKLYLV